MSNDSMTNVHEQAEGATRLYTMSQGLDRMVREGSSREFDLAERTAAFGEQIIAFALTVPETSVTRPLINQLVRAGTSIGANYLEADDADTRKDFRYRIGICKRESKESRYWLRMIKAAMPELAHKLPALQQEALELTRIFAAIRRNSVCESD
jgi:four helix bundle protein